MHVSFSRAKDLDEACPWDADEQTMGKTAPTSNLCKTDDNISLAKPEDSLKVETQQKLEETQQSEIAPKTETCTKSEDSSKQDCHLKPDATKRHRSHSKRRRERKKSVTASPGTFQLLEEAHGLATSQLLSNSDNKDNAASDVIDIPPREPMLSIVGPTDQLSIKYVPKEEEQGDEDQQHNSAEHHPSGRSMSAPGGSTGAPKDIEISPLNRKKTKNLDNCEKIIRKGSVNSNERMTGTLGEVQTGVAFMCSIAPIPSAPTPIIAPPPGTSALVAPVVALMGEGTSGTSAPTAIHPPVAATSASSAPVEVTTAQTQTLAKESSSQKQRHGFGIQENETRRLSVEEHGDKIRREETNEEDKADEATGSEAQALNTKEEKVDMVVPIVEVPEGAAGGGGEEEDGSNGCWMEPQDICPWEDE